MSSLEGRLDEVLKKLDAIATNMRQEQQVDLGAHQHVPGYTD